MMLRHFFGFFKPAQKIAPIHIEKNCLQQRYQQLVFEKQIKMDSAQVALLPNLQRLLDDLCALTPTLSSKHFIESLYIFGQVGRGKSLLMVLFFDACPILQKRRVHFHDFMLEVHAFVHQWRHHHNDPLQAFAQHLRRTTWLMCFDEFNVTDIADAMILTRLFYHLWAEGIIFVATSNYHPDNLYQGGLQHALFLPFITRLKQTADILELVANIDYRLMKIDPLTNPFYVGRGRLAQTFLEQKFLYMTQAAQGMTESYVLKTQGRTVYFKTCINDNLYSSFTELCHRPLGSADYSEISKQFRVIFIANIPELSLECRDDARRFVTLIDALYERHVQLICTLAVPIELLYIDDGVFEFKRTRSRLMEMQSQKYQRSLS